MSRQLASVQKIIDIKSIDGADKIELAFVKGWQVVIAKKDGFKIGDLCVYIEVDSIMPEKPEYEFLRERKFRVRTIKLRKQLSQGLILPLSVLPTKSNFKENDDVTELLGVVKYDPQAQEEASLLTIPKHRNKVLSFCMGYAPFRKVYLSLNSQEHGNFPTFVTKTDEENIQNMVNIISNNFEKSFYVSEKLEGQSGSFFTYDVRTWGFKHRAFGVASRNVWLKTRNNSNYWKMAEKYKLEAILRGVDKRITLQGEQVGPAIQKNIYNLNEVELYIFNLVIDGVRKNYQQMLAFCEINQLKCVPLLDGNFIPAEHIKNNEKADIVKYLLDYSNGVSVMYPTKREGVVLRLNDNPIISVKARSPEYLIEHGE